MSKGLEDVSTREELLAMLIDSAQQDVEQLTITKERAEKFMTSAAVERNAALLAAKPEIGLREFVDAQEKPGGKFAALVAVVGNPFLVTCAAFEAAKCSFEELSGLVSMSSIWHMLEGPLDAATSVVHAVVRNNFEAELESASSEGEIKEIANKFMLACIERAIELALATGAGTIPGDVTPGVVH